MRLGISGYELAPGLDEVIRLARLLHVGLVEMWPQNMLPGGGQVVRQVLEQNGLAACAFTLPFAWRLNHPDEDTHLQRMHDALPVAALLGASALNVKVGAWPARTPQAALQRLVPMLHSLGDAAQRLGLRLLVENQVDEDGEDVNQANWSRAPENLRTLLDAVAHPAVGATYDPGNFLMAGYEPFPLAYDLLAPYVAYVHVKDAALDDGRTPALSDSLVFTDAAHRRRYRARPVGAGAINWAGLIERLRADGYDGVLLLDGFTPERGRDQFYGQTVAAMRSYLEPHAG